MKFFIDTANVDEIRQANEMGILDGVTTNPTLVAKEGRDFKDLIAEICSIVSGPVSAEVLSLQEDGMVNEAKQLAKIANNVVIKIPVCIEGLKATKRLSAEGINVNMTLIFSPTQGILAAKAGAAYASPFVGRLDDHSHFGMDLIDQLVQIYQNYDFETEIIVASIRNPIHVVQAALMGAHIATIPFKIISQLLKHPLTDIGIDRFMADWKSLEKGKI